ncbi:transporter substrate-binding domain-containing protein [Jiella sp. M17.18]|uniref:transporter substrate-binding domain-containing protein n=1 Tax=Jiella sp. M17.18 TaxID=3234247 RepID=UPI0034DE5C83
MFRSTLIAAAAALLLGAAPTMAKTLTAGANIGNVPWEFQDQNGDTVGFEVDLLKEVANRLGYDKVDIQNIPFNGLFSAVQSGRIDVAISSITITDERLKSVSFAQPYYDSDQSLSTKTDSGIKSTKDLKGKVVGVDTGSTGDMYATQRKDEWGLSDIRRYEGLNPAMLDLAAGRIDAYVSDIPAVAYYLKDKPQMKVVERLKTGEQYSMMFAKDSPLALKVNDVLTTLKKEGFIANLHKKWFGSMPEDTTSSVAVMDMPKPKS